MASVATVSSLPDALQEEVGLPPQAAGARQPPPYKPRCGNCGLKHKPGKGSYPAEMLACHNCGKTGHLCKMCRSKGKQVAATEEMEASGIIIAATRNVERQPFIWVKVSIGNNERKSAKIQVVPDTGAQVCVAGPGLLAALNIIKTSLVNRGNLKDVANVSLKPIGSFTCCIQHGSRTTTQEIYILETATRCYVSLQACKDLGLVHADFPYQSPVVAPTSADVGNATSESADYLLARPDTVPLTPLEENVPQLEAWLLRHFSGSTFNTDRSPLPVMEGKPHSIHLLPDAKPYACHTPASVPRHWEAKVKKQLDEDIRKGILEPVPVGEVTEWCARMVVVAKKSGQPRRTVDYQKLNAACKRETHHTRTPFDLVSGIPRHTYKTTSDAHWGFHQVELQEDSKRLTTFITPWGRYRYRRTPMGHCAAPDAYTRRFDEAIEDIQRKFKCVDDTLLFDNSVEEAFWHTYDFLETCARKGVTLKPEKFKFCRRQVDFVGFHVGWDAFKPTEERLAAIRNVDMPAEPSLTDIRSWHGFVNQLAPFLATAPIMEPFRELLKKPQGKKVYWDENLKEKFRQAKDVICKLAKEGLSFYDKDRPTVVVTDWSKVGIGFVVLQQHCSCHLKEAPFCCKSGWRLALCGSRHLTSAEAGYAQVEGEALAVAWCLRKARLFLLGCPNLIVITDHRPLVKLLGDRELKDIANPRLFGLKEKTLHYRFQIKYLPGKRNSAADFLSRYPALCAPPDATDEEDANDMEGAMAAATVAALNCDDCIVLDSTTVVQAPAEDPEYQLLVAKVTAGDWHPHRAQELVCLRHLYGVRDRLAVSQGLVMYTYGQGSVRLVIPIALRKHVAENLHAGHQGLDGMLRRARQTVYWPGMEGDLQHHRDVCAVCNAYSPSQAAEPLTLTPPPKYPFQHTVADLFQLDGQMYLAYADRLTGWLEIAHFPSGATSSKLLSVMRQYFQRWGAPESISTDGGTNLTSEEMSNFLERWGVERRVSSAHFPQSNGRAEVAVKSAKRLLRANTGGGGSLRTDKVSVALLQYLNTQLRGVKKSPAQLAMGRQLRDGVPAHQQHYKVDSHWRGALRARERESVRQQGVWVERQGATRTLPPLMLGTQVWVQNQETKVWDRRGVVMETLPHRQYRRHLRAVRGSSHPTQPPSPNLILHSTRSHPTHTEATGRPQRRVKQPAWMSDYIAGTQ
ncbi:hypothetical protein Pcinc_006984 [Petrolisthes cinctipes]|uniref:RNA-directed DNA polymerase n=1 Tax=Petrolisthes cinctipes TaxID=88211 RepID=A0AAE1GC22_PETCI|nr:hypothetical protein Pcinc_006984 [Petrolisthes cinctipes]